MSTRQLILASTWALEGAGVDEFQAQVKKLKPGVDIEYLVPDHVVTIKGSMDDVSCKEYSSMLRDFIERHKHANLLEMPRIRPLLSADSDDIKPVRTLLTEDNGSDLLLLDDSSVGIVEDTVQEVIPKFWLPSNGALGYFAKDRLHVLRHLAESTGTELSVDDAQGVRVCGQNQADVEEALEKLGALESSLSLIDHPYKEIAVIAPEGDAVTLSFVNYAGQNQAALRRILATPDSRNSSLCRMLVPALYHFNTDTQSWDAPHNICDPPHVDVESSGCWDWQDFTFPEIGCGEGFGTSGLTDEDKAITTETTPEHPFLTPLKAQQVDEWVTHGAATRTAETDTELFAEPPHELVLASRRQGDLSSPSKKRPSGLKTRKVIPKKYQELAATPSCPPDIDAHDAAHKTVIKKPAEPDRPILERVQLKYNTVFNGTSSGASPSGEAKLELDKDVSEHFQTRTEIAKKDLAPPCGLGKDRSGNVPREDILKNLQPSPLKGITKSVTQHETPQQCIKFVETEAETTRPLQPSQQQPFAFHQPAVTPLESLLKNARLEPRLLESYRSFPQSGHYAAPINSVPQDIRPPPGLSSPLDTTSGSVLFQDKFSEYESRLSTLRAEPVHFASASAVASQDVNKSFAKQFLLTHIQTSTGPHVQEKNLLTDNRSIVSFPSAPPGLGTQRFYQRFWGFEDTRESQERLAAVEETQTRDFHYTMIHQVPRPSGKKAEAKAHAKARREAILADAWGSRTDAKEKDNPAKPIKESSAVKADLASLKKQRITEQQGHHIKTVFHLLNPVLTAAESYPGPLGLEFQFGLVLIPTLRAHSIAKEDKMTLKAMQRFFLPQNGLPPPSSTFFSRLTTSPADVDYIIDFKVGGRRIFEKSVADYHIQYEFHCQRERGNPLIITVDDQGKSFLSKPAAVLGSVHLSFPGHIWDAAAVLKSPIEHLPGSDPTIEEAARCIVANLWVEPNRSLIRLHTRLPKDQLTINKVFMKRWTRHRYLRPEGETADNDLFLQVTEVQDLLISIQTADLDIVEANCSPLSEMVKSDRQWWEVAVVSPVVDALLSSNATLELGERTDEWTSHELLGRDVALVPPPFVKAAGDIKTSMELSTSTLISNAIGNAGLGELFRLTKLVVAHIDSVGFWNNGPGVDAAQKAGLDVGSSEIVTSNPAAVSSGQHAEGTKGSEDLASGSATKVAVMPVKQDTAPSQGEVFEFW